VLDGGGALTPPLASRVVGDVARALQAVHGFAGAGPKALAHGAVRAENVLVCEDGAVLLTGLGRPVEPPPLPSDDLAALPRLLAECLAPGGAGAVPPELAPLVADALPGDLPRPAGDFADALAAAVLPAAPGALVARVDSALPKGASARASRRRAIAQALLAEAGGEAGPLLSPPAGTPALSPPPIRPPAVTPVPGISAGAAPPERPATPPTAERPNLTPPPLRRGSLTPVATAAPAAGGAAPPGAAHPPQRGGGPGPIPAVAAAPARPPAAAPSPEERVVAVRVVLALAAVGLVIGFLLGRG